MTLQAHTSNVISLQAARDARQGELTALAPDRRNEQRFVCHERVFVQVVLSASRPELVGRTFACRAANVSTNGMHIITDAALPEDALVDLWIDMSARPGKFFLSGSVRWNRDETDSNGKRYAVGVRLDDGPATDIDQWRELLP